MPKSSKTARYYGATGVSHVHLMDGENLPSASVSVVHDSQDLPQSQYPLPDGIPPFHFPKTTRNAGSIGRRRVNHRLMRNFLNAQADNSQPHQQYLYGVDQNGESYIVGNKLAGQDYSAWEAEYANFPRLGSQTIGRPGSKVTCSWSLEAPETSYDKTGFNKCIMLDFSREYIPTSKVVEDENQHLRHQFQLDKVAHRLESNYRCLMQYFEPLTAVRLVFIFRALKAEKKEQQYGEGTRIAVENTPKKTALDYYGAAST